MREIEYSRLMRDIKRLRQTLVHTHREIGYDDAILTSISMVRDRFKGSWNSSEVSDDARYSDLFESMKCKYKNHLYETKFDQGFRTGLEDVVDVIKRVRGLIE